MIKFIADENFPAPVIAALRVTGSPNEVTSVKPANSSVTGLARWWRN
jgi:hypothetical protein